MLVSIVGNTYPVKNELKAIGAKWNKDRKVWQIESAKADEAKAIVHRSKQGSALYVMNSGAEYYVNRRGRCIDAPCCGCCS